MEADVDDEDDHQSENRLPIINLSFLKFGITECIEVRNVEVCSGMRRNSLKTVFSFLPLEVGSVKYVAFRTTQYKTVKDPVHDDLGLINPKELLWFVRM